MLSKINRTFLTSSQSVFRSKHTTSFTYNEATSNFPQINSLHSLNTTYLRNGILFVVGIFTPSLYFYLNNLNTPQVDNLSNLVKDKIELAEHPTSLFKTAVKSSFLTIFNQHFTKETLRGKYFIEAEFSGPLIKVLRFGSKVSGHNGIVHGGLLATVLQESAREFVGLDSSVEGQFLVNYRAPALTNHNFVIVGQSPRNTSSGLEVRAVIKDETGRTYTDIVALFPGQKI